jgi:hypothetical protein
MSRPVDVRLVAFLAAESQSIRLASGGTEAARGEYFMPSPRFRWKPAKAHSRFSAYKAAPSRAE